MLCPKCGFISFDHFSVCVKCQNDLSQIKADLHGTSTDAACCHFLGMALKEGAASQGKPPERELASETIVVPLVQEAENNAARQSEAGSDDDFSQKEASLVFSDDESPSLEMDDEIPQLDLSSFEPIAIETESLPPRLPENLSPVDTPEISSETLKLDTFSLELDSVQLSLEESGGMEDDSLPLSQQPQIEGASSEKLTIDLDEIDLSDLVHDQGSRSSAHDNSGALSDGDNGLDFGDTMDLSLFVGDSHDTHIDPEFSPSNNDLEPIDLTLMDEALVELFVDPSRKESSIRKNEPSKTLS